MMPLHALLNEPRQEAGEPATARIAILTSKGACRDAFSSGLPTAPSQCVVHAAPRTAAAPSLPYASENARRYALWSFPHASPASVLGAGKQKTALQDRSKRLISLRKFGAGEGIRTLDPNLGKVRNRLDPHHCNFLGLPAPPQLRR